MTDSSNSFIFQGTKQPWLIFFRIFSPLLVSNDLCTVLYIHSTANNGPIIPRWVLTLYKNSPKNALSSIIGGWCFYRTTSKITKIGCPRFCTTHLLFPSELSLQHDHYSWLAKLCQRGVFLFIFLRALKNSQNSSNKKGLLGLYKNCFCYICSTYTP